MSKDECKPESGGIPLSKLPAGTLNQKIREDIYDSFAVPSDDFMDVFVKVVKKTFGPNHSMVNSKFVGICLQVLDSEETQRLIASGQAHEAFKKIAATSNKKTTKACRVYIPEVHGDRALPNDIYNPSKKDLEVISAFFPVFLANTEKEAALPINAGDLLEVEIKNNLGGGVFLHRLSDSTVNVFKNPGGSSASFKCSILKSSKIKNLQDQKVTSGTVIAEGKDKTASALSEATLKQQYIKYLYEKERFFIKELNDFWFHGAGIQNANLPKFRRAVGNVVNEFLATDAGTFLIQNGNSDSYSKKLVWLLISKLSGFMPTGVANAGATVIQVDSLNDYYGIFKATKKQYDTRVEKVKDMNLKPNDPRLNLLEKDHSDLLDPEFAIKFFLIDFDEYLKSVNKKSWPTDTGAAEDSLGHSSIQKLVVNYFTGNDKRIGYVFTNDYKEIISLLDGAETSEGLYKSGKPSFSEFVKFDAFLAAAKGGVALEVKKSDKSEAGKTENSPNLQQTKPKDTKDECHSNYPPKNSYLIHVDSQKKAIEQFMNSSLAGEELKFSSYKHVGVKNVRFGGIEIPSKFKVIRFDGLSNFPKDNVCWRDAANPIHLVEKERSRFSYYRSKSKIKHFVIHSINAGLTPGKFYKSLLRFLSDTNRPFPHFLVATDGQIIQLVDAAAITNNFLPNKESSISAAFIENNSSLPPLNSQISEVSMKNYILIKQSASTTPPGASVLLNTPGGVGQVETLTEEPNIYRPHRIGTKAALQAMQSLVQFFIENTNMEYNLAAQDFKLLNEEINKSNIQASGHYKGIGGMNFIYYAWTYGLAYKNNGRNILSAERGYG